MEPSLIITICRFSAAGHLGKANDWHKHASIQFQKHFQVNGTTCEHLHPLTKIGTTARSDHCWLFKWGSTLNDRLRYSPPDAHIMLMIKGRDGAFVEREPWQALNRNCGSKNVSVIIAEKRSRLVGEVLMGWEMVEGSELLWARYELNGMINSYQGRPPSPPYRRLLEFWEKESTWRKNISKAIAGNRRSGRNTHEG